MGLFGGGDSDVSSAQGHSQASINSSGWVVGGGSAKGGNLTSSAGVNLPWYGWASFGVIALAWWHYRKRGK